jgi:hypothetical protein
MSQLKAQDVLDKLDRKPFGFFHIKMIVVRRNSYGAIKSKA